MKAAEKNKSDGLADSSLQLLAPPIRLVSAAMWKVMLQRDVMFYGQLEQFVTSITATVPGLLNYRHLAKLTVGLRARVILEEIRMSHPCTQDILSHLEQLHAPVLSYEKKKDQKVELAIKNFRCLGQSLLKDPAERIRFFEDEFNSQYGPDYDSALEKLLWEFLTRLDQLMPVPDLAQTVEWVTGARAIVAACVQRTTQPLLLRCLLMHERCLGHLNSADSIPSSMGDSILSSLSLPLSGNEKDAEPSGSTATSSKLPNTTPKSTPRLRRCTVSITPVIGSITCKDLPQKVSSTQKFSKDDDDDDDHDDFVVKSSPRRRRSKTRSKSLMSSNEGLSMQRIAEVSQSTSSSETDDDDVAQVKAVKRKSIRISVVKQNTRRNGSPKQSGSKLRGMKLRSRVDDEISTNVNEDDTRGVKAVRENKPMKSNQIDVDFNNKPQKSAQTIKSKGGEGQPGLLDLCTKRQLQVVIPRLDPKNFTQSALANSSEQPATTTPKSATKNVSTLRNRKRKLDFLSTPEKKLTDITDNQQCAGSPCIPTIMTVRMRNADMESPAKSTDEVIVDSEDEAPEKVKGRLFLNRYSKTKNNTYVPTLREFLVPALVRRDLLSPGNGYR